MSRLWDGVGPGAQQIRRHCSRRAACGDRVTGSAVPLPRPHLAAGHVRRADRRADLPARETGDRAAVGTGTGSGDADGPSRCPTGGHARGPGEPVDAPTTDAPHAGARRAHAAVRSSSTGPYCASRGEQPRSAPRSPWRAWRLGRVPRMGHDSQAVYPTGCASCTRLSMACWSGSGSGPIARRLGMTAPRAASRVRPPRTSSSSDSGPAGPASSIPTGRGRLPTAHRRIRAPHPENPNHHSRRGSMKPPCPPWRTGLPVQASLKLCWNRSSCY